MTPQVDHLALFSDAELFELIETEEDEDTRKLLENEGHWRACGYALSQQAN